MSIPLPPPLPVPIPPTLPIEIAKKLADMIVKKLARPLHRSEINLARTVFGSTIPFSKVFMTKGIYSAPVTISTDKNLSKTVFLIAWEAALKGDMSVGKYERSTLIHEMTHVWQGTYGPDAQAYLSGAFGSQISEGTGEAMRDLLKNGSVKGGWDRYRSAAYVIGMKDMRNSFSSFNPEQQAMIVETWFQSDPYNFQDGTSIAGGSMSKTDPRYPYIQNNILAGKPNAPYFNFREDVSPMLA